MRVFAASAVAAISALALVLGACSVGGAADLASSAGSSGGPTAGEPNLGDEPDSLEFAVVNDLSAREQVTLHVHARPAKRYHVLFGLPSSGGDPLDAILDAQEADTDDTGTASVQLTAPSTPTRFDVRASVGAAAVGTLTVTVKDTGFASLLVQAQKYVGSRMITTWVASAHPNKTCAELPGIPPEDGPLQTLPASSGGAPLLNRVPASTPLAVTLRSGHFVGGCASIEGVPPGPEDQPQTVLITVLDRPIDLSVSSLAVSFGLPTPEPSWNDALTTTANEVLGALPGTSIDDVDAILDAMRDASGDSRQAFETARQGETWDVLIRADWGAGAATKLHDLVAGWLSAGRQRFRDSEHLFTGSLTPIQQPPGTVAGPSAALTLQSVAGLDGATSGFVNRAQVSWSASSDDTLVLGTDLYFVQSQLAAALAEAAALNAAPGVDGAAPLLAQALDCEGIGDLLAATGTDDVFAYGTCDAACVTELCQSAVATMWRRGEDATALSPARLGITATGGAHVGDVAEVAGMRGSWIGELHTGAELRTTGGELTATVPVVSK